jgi:hypothetical protein
MLIIKKHPLLLLIVLSLCSKNIGMYQSSSDPLFSKDEMILEPEKQQLLKLSLSSISIRDLKIFLQDTKTPTPKPRSTPYIHLDPLGFMYAETLRNHMLAAFLPVRVPIDQGEQPTPTGSTKKKPLESTGKLKTEKKAHFAASVSTQRNLCKPLESRRGRYRLRECDEWHVCTINNCGKKLLTPACLKTHQAFVHGVGSQNPGRNAKDPHAPIVETCEYCNGIFTRISSFDSHKKKVWISAEEGESLSDD